MPQSSSTSSSVVRRISLLVLIGAPLAALPQVVGDSVNMVSGTEWPGGDPFLQRQNEPSIAVSSANPMHLLAGANDYRTVDVANPFQAGEPRKMPGDAWQGVFKSYDGGQTWKSYLMPGYPQDTSADGLSSAAQLRPDGQTAYYNAAADSVVRAGTDGMFYFAGIVFKRGTNDGRVVLNRFIDLNDKEGGNPIAGTDPIRWIDAKVIDQGGAWFADKPWIAVDVPRPGARTCNIQRFGRTFAGGAVYVVWARIHSGTASDIMFSRSLDCGETWSAPLKLNDQKSQASQGASISVDPRTGYVYATWRRFGVAGASPKQDEDAIFAVRSFSGGQKFTNPRLVTTFVPFEQGQGALRFRTEAFPTIATSVDATGTRSWTHVAWSQRGANGDGQVVMTNVVVSAPPKTFDEWTDPLDGWKIPPDPVDAAPVFDRPGGVAFTRGHQFMPALTFSQGRLVLVYYDSRLDHTRTYYTPHLDPCAPVGSCWVPNAEGRWYDEERGPLGDRTSPDWWTVDLDDASMVQTRHTVDLRVATALASPSPVFTSTMLSRMPFGARGDEQELYPAGVAPGFAATIPVLDTGASPAALRKLQDLQVNPPNLPMFKNGTVPFIGDYIDVQGPVFVRTATGWAFDWAPSAAPVFHATWTSNQDVVPPPDGDWTRYTPPARAPGTVSVYDPGQVLPGCDDRFTGTRNQNVYTARITEGIVVTSPQNAKLLVTGRDRTFVVSAFNGTGVARTFRFTFETLPSGVRASFRPDTQPLAPSATVTIPPRSAAVQTAFLRVVDGTDPAAVNPATTVVRVTEVVSGNVQPLTGFVVLNPPGLTFGIAAADAGEVLDVQLSAASLYYANLSNANLSNANLSNANLSNANLSNANLSNANLSNANLSNADPASFTLEAAHLSNANLSNTDLASANLSNANLSNANLSNANLSNANLSNANLSNATLADIDYTVTNTGNTTQGFDVGLFTTGTGFSGPVQLVVSRPYAKPIAVGCNLVEQPDNQMVVNAGTVDPSLDPATRPPLATVAIAPGETVRVTLRTALTPYEARTLATQIAPRVAPQGRPDGGATALIVTRPAATEAAVVGQAFDATLAVSGGIGTLSWSLASGSALPPGFDPALLRQGRLAGTPTQAGTFTFTLQVVDAAPLPNQMFKDVTLVVQAGNATTTLSPVPATLYLGEAASFTATVAPAVAGGVVTFLDGEVPFGTAAVGANGSATLTLPSLALGVGAHSISARRETDANWAASRSAAQQARVKVRTSLTLAADPSSPVYGQSLALVASLQPLPPGTPAPTVPATFLEGATALGSASFSQGVAVSPPFSPTGGDHFYGVTFPGDENYDAFSVSGIRVGVAAASVTDVVVTSGPSPALLGSTVTFTGRVRATGGSVTFEVDGVAVGTAPVVPDLPPGDGLATFRTTALTLGSHRVTARFSGAPNYTDAGSLVGASQEIRGTTGATISVSPSPSALGQAVTLTCVVTSAAGAPTGSVTFLDGGSAIGTAPVSPSGTGTSSTFTLATASLGAGSHSLSCSYPRQGYFEAATSAAITHLVGPIPTTTAATAGPASAAWGTPITLTATVTSTTGVPSGSVTFTTSTASGVKSFGPVALGAGGAATTTATGLDVGTYTFQASYSGSALHAPSTSPATGPVSVVSAWKFTGFLTPLKAAGTFAAPTYSGTQKLGSAIPVKWQVTTATGAFVSDLGTLRSLLAYPVPCSPLGPPTGSSPLVLYVIPGGATGNSTYRYGSNTFIFNWDTSGGVVPGCFDLVLTLKDGTVRSTVVKLQ